MSFDSIPPGLLLKMFDRLPFKDRVRLRGVNRLFNEISWRSINTMRSLEINHDLEAYSIWTQTFTSLLESCSSTLESIDTSNRSCTNLMLSALTEFVFPKLERLEIAVTNNELTKKLISRNRNLRTVVLYLDREFEWPEDTVSEKLKNLEIQSSKESSVDSDSPVNLSPTLCPLIGMVPNLERLKIHGEFKSAPFIIPVQELNQLLAAVPCLKMLYLLLFRLHENSISAPFNNMCQNLVAALPTWHLPNLTYFLIAFKYPIPSPILQHFSTTSPQLESFTLGVVTGFNDQDLLALSKLKRLRRLALPGLEITRDKFTKMINLLPSLTQLQFYKMATEDLPLLAQLRHLRILQVYNLEITKAEIIDVITNLPTLAILEIRSIPDARFHDSFTDFVTTTAALFNRNLKIQPYSMCINGNESELDHMKAVLEEIGKNGGPVVDLDGRDVHMIGYRSLA